MARIIELTQGHVTIVDDEDFDQLSKHRWKIFKVKGVPKYAARTTGARGMKTILMHRQILQAVTGIEVDHKDGNGLDNRRTNLRIATHRQNMANGPKKPKHGNPPTSQFKGVYWNKERGKWQAQIARGDGGVAYLGRFTLEEEAANAYDKKAIELFGEFARLNFPR